MQNTCKKLFAALVIGSVAAAFVAAEPITLTMSFYKQEITQSLPKLLDAFNKANPDIVVTTEIHPNDGGATQAAAAAAGKLPDIIMEPAYAAVVRDAKQGYLVDLTNQPVMKKVIEGSLPGVTYKGKLYAIPMDFAGIGIIYNKAIFKKYNLKAPTTYLELQKVADTLKKNGITPFAGLLKENWSIGHFMAMLHGSMLGAKSGTAGINKFVTDMDAGKTSWGKAIDTAAMFKIMDWYVSNMDANAFEMNWNEQQAAFAQEKAAMMVQGLWSYGAAIGTNPKLDCGFIPFMWSNKAAENKFFADTDSTFAVSAQSSKEKQAAALKFINWLSSPEAIKIWTSECKLTSTIKGADVKSMEVPFQELMDSVNKLGSYPWIFQMMPTPTWEQAIKNGALGYVMGKTKPVDVIAEIDKSWKENYRP